MKFASESAIVVNLLCAITWTTCIQVVEVPPEYHNTTPSEYVQNTTDNGRAIENGVGVKEERTTQQKHPCNRKCEINKPMLCEYKFQIEYYQTMSKACYDCPYNITHCSLKDCVPADGVKRTISVVNRQLPGPSIEVCHGDTIEVTIENSLFEETTSIHWHGQHQKESPFMDGVPFVTQCPISPRSTFIYRFKASIAGTHFWHSHSAFQRGDGIFGSLIVRVPPSADQYHDLYDHDLSEHVINIIDWTHSSGLSKYVAHHHSDGDNKPVNILINGKGRFQEFEDENQGIHYTPMERFIVTRGLRYRFRLINSGFLNCPIEMSIDNHTLVVISSDGADLEPVEAQSLVSYAGERFDFIVEMNQEVDNYWFRFRGLMDCDERFNSVFQAAILHYEGATDADPEPEVSYDFVPEGLQINSLNMGLNTSGSLILPELRSPPSRCMDPRLKPKPDHKFFISYDFYPKDNTRYHLPSYYGFYQAGQNQKVYTPQLNHITMQFPAFPLLANIDETNKLQFCNASSIPPECETEYCECIHVLRVRKNAIVEMIIIDKGFTYDANHPFHLHGYNFRVIGMDRLGPNVTEATIRDLDEKGLLARNLRDAPIKDTITVPDGGYTIVRWKASNPGFWLFHCHIEFHMEIGMALAFKIGEDSDFPKPPKNFPQCHHYKPSEETTEESITYKNYKNDDNNEIVFNEIVENFLEISSQSSSLSKSGHSAKGLSRGLIFFTATSVILIYT